MDETYKVALTRFSDRIRVAGTAELAGFDPAIPEARKATIEMVARDLFPHGGDFAKGQFWTGCPMTPDGTPIIGATPIPISIQILGMAHWDGPWLADPPVFWPMCSPMAKARSAVWG